MAVDMHAYLHGYRTHRLEILCPQCGQRLKREYDDAARRELRRCVNPACPFLTGRDETPLIQSLRAIRQRQGGK